MNEFTQHPIYTNYYVSKDGRYYFIKKNGEATEPKRGTLCSNRYGKPLMYEACVTISKHMYTVINVGRLVLETYKGFAPDETYIVTHLDKDPLNNDISNLEWMTVSDNREGRRMPKWATDRHAIRLEKIKKLGYKTWGEFLSARRKAKHGKTHNIQDNS